ncbi:MAG TPA: hypothetical protein VKM55_19075 [Candidatus Lokiarchaeia archaeon]|nr:hypothetical protein [Candidatus Lokiarchaeia archaeon]
MVGISENDENIAKEDLPQEEHDEGLTIQADAGDEPESSTIAEHAIPEQAVEASSPESRIHLKCSIKCSDCSNNKSLIPEIVLEQKDASGLLTIKFSGRCGCPSRIIINHDFELLEHSCASFKPREHETEAFDFDEFLESDKEIDDILAEKPVKPAQKLVTVEDQMKMAVKRLAKPLALLIPTTAQKKTEEQLRVEREERMRELVGTDVNLVYLRVLEFEKLAASNNSYPIDKFSKSLKDLDKGSIIGFIKKVNNDFLITFNEDSQAIRFFNPSKPELEILSREFEKWLRFNRL